MAWNPVRTNQLLFTYGDIQCSPAEIQQLNAKPPTRYIPPFAKSGVSAGYEILFTGYSRKIYDQELSTGNSTNIHMALNELRSIPRQINGKQLKGSIDTWSLEGRYYRLDYRIVSGQVIIHNIQLIDSMQKARDRLEKAALYHVKKTQGVWRVAEKTDSVKPGYAAVNGQSNNLAKAPWLMGAHLEFEFGKGIQEFTLFHNPSIGGAGDTWESLRDKMGFTTDVTRKFAEVLNRTQAEGKEVKWLAHSQGGVIFSEAVRYILNGNSSWALHKLSFNGINRKDKGSVLDKQSIAMHGNANNNFRSSYLFERAGVKVISKRANSYDFVNVAIGLNSANPWRWIGSAVYWNHVTGGSVQQSPHTLMHRDWESWNDSMTNGPGKGRGPIQKGFNAVDKAGRHAIKVLSNYLK